MTTFLKTQSFSSRVVRLVVTLCILFLLFQFVSLYLSWPKQVILGAISIAIVLVLNRRKHSSVITISLMLLSLAATLRYGWWRVHLIVQFFGDESNSHFTIDSVLMLVLLSAEAYTIVIMLLGYMQTVAPLHRKPLPLPLNEDLWPHVDVLIPTYNEALSLVRYTALAAINIDYPPAKLHVYILDDGTREDFRLFAEEAGIGYITRKEHNHAKAGNINHALTKMSAPLVAIFDCDHVPTRSFLQVTVGWFLAEKNLAMLQTPHFFYSPDPFERNLPQYKTIPNEGELFYGVIQDGSDLWNATFFCGSCAVIRRSALDEVGGIAVETVTEDAHTSLRMQKRGWNTAYINLPQAAGLATETLSAHVGQRIRWARGMIQIFRTENPLLASKMKLTQRLCYFNAMLHFMYAVPRLVFLCAPLVYMVFGLTIIPGYWVAILAYALPHLVISSVTNSRVQGRFRHSFWNEIYETVLAPYILLPTLLALINPKLGKFNVTDKGSTLKETKFDRNISSPTTLLLAFNLLGICMTPYRLRVTDPNRPGTVISNLIWIFFNMVILGVAGAVAHEKQQRRTAMRIPAQVPVALHLDGDRNGEGLTTNISVGGAAMTTTSASGLEVGHHLRISFPQQTRSAQIGATVMGKTGDSIRLKFDATTIVEQETLTRALYSRANSWISLRAKGEEDRPLVSLGRVILISFTGFKRILLGLLPRRNTVGILLLAASLGLLHKSSSGQIPGTITTPEPPPATAQPITASAAQAVPSADTTNVQLPPEVTASTADEKITLKDMGVQGAIDMHAPHSYYSVGFVLPNDRLPLHAALELSYHFSHSIVPHTGSIRAMVNGVPIGVIQAPEQPQAEGQFAFISFRVPPELLIRNNDITFEFTGGSVLQTESSARTAVLASIGATSRILVAGDHLPLKTDLGLLPQPFFDPDLQTTTTIPFVFLSSPSPRTLQAAAIVASWFGIQASSKPVRYTVSVGNIPAGNVVIFANGDLAKQPNLQVSAGGGALTITANPSDPDGSALVLSADDDSQLVTVARALALMKVSHLPPGQRPPSLGKSVRIGNFALPAQRKPDDAPRWLTTDKLTSLWATTSQQAMQSNGSKPLPVYFRVPPDLYYGEIENLNLRLNYRYNAMPLAPDSALRGFLNGSLISEVPLPPGSDFADRQRTVLVPVAKMRPFGNTFLFNFDFIPSNPNSDAQNGPNKLFGSILQESWLDIRGLDHWAPMPNLELFANAGFPFTRKADLSDTSVVMPVQPTAKEIELLLYVMSHCGMQTGYPVLRVDIVGPDAVMTSTHDYLIIGGVDDQPAFESLDPALPVTFDSNGIHVKESSGFLATLKQTWQKWTGGTQESQPSNVHGESDLMIEGLESPSYPGRSIVLLSLRNPQAVDEFADAFLERSQSSDISGSVSLLRNGKFNSFDMNTSTYHVGDISWYALMRLWFAQHFWLLLAAVSLLSLPLAGWIRDYLVWLAAKRVSVEDPA